MEKPETEDNGLKIGVVGARLLGALLGLGGCAVVGGAQLAPGVQGALLALGRSRAGLVGLRDLPFERVVTRCVLVVMLLGLAPALRWGGVRGPGDLGLPRGRAGGRELVAGVLAGMAMILAVLLPGYGLGAYRVAADAGVLGAVLFLPAALLVGVIEEVLFRGALYRSMRAVGGVWLGAASTSLLFSAVHFAAPVPTVGIAHAHWYSGLQLIPDTFRLVHAGYHYFPFMLTLFLMGVALCLVVERTGRLYAAIGLHAGWVWALRGGAEVLQRAPDRLPALFGWDNQPALGYGATAVMALLVLGLAVWPRPPAPEAP